MGNKSTTGGDVQSIHLIQICVAAVVGGLLGAAVCGWLGRQKIDQLQQRLARSEEARNGAIERSVHAREQIGQLSKAISDLRRAHHTVRQNPLGEATTSADERRALAERALEAAAAHDARSASSGKVVLFANTQPMEL
jgi:thioesterase domain-containing protein